MAILCKQDGFQQSDYADTHAGTFSQAHGSLRDGRKASDAAACRR